VVVVVGGAVVVVVVVVVDVVVVGRGRVVVVVSGFSASVTSVPSPGSTALASSSGASLHPTPPISSTTHAMTIARPIGSSPAPTPPVSDGGPYPALTATAMAAGRQTGAVDTSRADRPTGTLAVRELAAAEMDVRIRYFHDASDEHLELMGVDRALLPPPDEWAATYITDAALPREERTTASLAWELDDEIVGFASLSQITYGDEAFFHLHLLEAGHRHRGLGVPFVRLSAARFVELFALRRLLSEPNAFNVAPHRTLQRAGFRYVRTHVTAPGPFNPPQPVTRWVLDAEDLVP
jgi:RimJ/RimL family protein N-acetyltransferase